MAPDDMHAAGDGEVLTVLDLRQEEGLAAAGLARELINRVQKLRKAAGLVVTDAVHIYYRTEEGADSASCCMLCPRSILGT